MKNAEFTRPEEKTKRRRSANGPQNSRKAQVAERRRRLVEASIKVISKRGLTGVTINSIAAETKCSYGVVAFHFQSKEGIIFAALDHSAAEYEAQVARLNAADLGPAERIRRMIDTDFDGKTIGRDAIALWLAFWAEAARIPAFRKRCAALREHYNRATAADLNELAALRGVSIDAEQMAVSLNAMISGLWIENLLNPAAFKEGLQRGREACLAYLRLQFPDDF